MAASQPGSIPITVQIWGGEGEESLVPAQDRNLATNRTLLSGRDSCLPRNDERPFEAEQLLSLIPKGTRHDYRNTHH